MDEKEIMEEIEKFDITNIEFNLDNISPTKILKMSPKLNEEFKKVATKRLSNKKREKFMYDFFRLLNEWMHKPENYHQVLINTTVKRFEPMKLSGEQIQTIIEIYGCINEEEVKKIKNAYAIKLLLSSLSK